MNHINLPHIAHVIIDAVNDGIVLLNANQEVVYINHVVARLLNYDDTELLGEPIERLLAKDFVKRVISHWHSQQRVHDVDGDYPTHLIDKHGKEIKASISLGKSIIFDRPVIIIVVRIQQHEHDPMEHEREYTGEQYSLNTLSRYK